jgi:excisionase family DNA binding protein
MPRRRTYVTQAQAAEHLQVTDRTIRRYISEGLITGYRLPGGRAVRVDLDECERVLTRIPATKPRKPYGPKAKIISIPEHVTAEGGEGK